MSPMCYNLNQKGGDSVYVVCSMFGRPLMYSETLEGAFDNVCYLSAVGYDIESVIVEFWPEIE